MAIYDDSNEICCSFCGKPHSQVRRLIAGPDIYICDECVRMCDSILADEFSSVNFEGKAQTESSGELPKPRDIHNALSDYVIDQEKAKKILAVAVYNH